MHAFGIGLPASIGLQIFDADFNPAISGVPASGFMAYNIIDAHAQPGRLANYGGAFAHRATFACEGPAGERRAAAVGALIVARIRRRGGLR